MSRLQRKKNFVDTHVQGALLRRICLHWVIFFLVSAVVIILLQALMGDPAKSILQRIQFEFTDFTFMGIVMVSLFPAFMLDTIRFSNRFVGPIARFRRHLRELKSGRVEHCTFRENDFWNSMADEFNSVADLVAEQQAEIDSLKSQIHAQAVTTS